MKQKIKQIYNAASSFCRRYINGTKGAVSLLLALTVSPLLTVALLLVESARYQSTVQLMEELTGIAAFSTLATYESYLEERFGLLATSQEADVSGTFSDALNENVAALGNGVTMHKSDAEGVYPLSDTTVLKQQLLENSEVSVAAEMVTETINLEEMIEKLEESLKVDDFEKKLKTAQAGVEIATKVEELIQAMYDIQEEYLGAYTTALNAYNASYPSFESAANDLLSARENFLEKLAAMDPDANVLEKAAQELAKNRAEEKLSDAISAFNTEKSNYRDKTSALQSSVTKLKGDIEKLMTAVAELPGKVADFETKKNSGSADTAVCDIQVDAWVAMIARNVNEKLSEALAANFSDVANAEVEALGNQAAALDTLLSVHVISGWAGTSAYAPKVITCIGNLPDAINNSIAAMNEESQVSEEATDSMSSFLDLAVQITGVQLAYNSNLDSKIDPTKLYSNVAMSRSSEKMIDSIKSLKTSGQQFVKAVTAKPGIFEFLAQIDRVVQIAKAVCNLLKAVWEFFDAIISWIRGACVNLHSFANGGSAECYNSLLLYGYAAYNLSNRVNCREGKSLSGFSYEDTYDLAGGRRQAPSIAGAIENALSLDDATGTDGIFKGAQAEYILVGSTSEISNQGVTFFDLYMLRLILDIGPVLKNPQLTSIAALASVGAWVIKLVAVLVEPMLDTILLCSGSDEYLLKTKTIYLSYSGLVLLLNKAADVTQLSDDLKDGLKKVIKDRNGEPTVEGFCEMSYAEHMMLLMLLCVNQGTYLQRLQNLIQLEAKENAAGSYDFNLDQAYTYVKTDVDYTMNPIFNIDSLTGSGLFRVDSQQYYGY